MANGRRWSFIKRELFTTEDTETTEMIFSNDQLLKHAV
jgi:hypothetical protein